MIRKGLLAVALGVGGFMILDGLTSICFTALDVFPVTFDYWFDIQLGIIESLLGSMLFQRSLSTLRGIDT